MGNKESIVWRSARKVAALIFREDSLLQQCWESLERVERPIIMLGLRSGGGPEQIEEAHFPGKSLGEALIRNLDVELLASRSLHRAPELAPTQLPLMLARADRGGTTWSSSCCSAGY